MKKIKNQKTQSSCRRKLKIHVFYWRNQQIEFSHSFIEMLAVGHLWMFLLKFPAQSRTITNTTSDQPGFHWCTLGRWFHTLHHCADKEPFFTETQLLLFVSAFPFQKACIHNHILVMCATSDLGFWLCHSFVIIHRLPVHCWSSGQWCTYCCLRSLNAVCFMAFSNTNFPFICTAFSFTSAFRYHSLMNLS